MPPDTALAQMPAPLTIRKPPREALAQLEKVVIEGNLATLTENERIGYYARVCESLGLNPLTRPFEYITLNGKLTLYARKDATDQLRDLHGVSIDRVEREREDDLAVVTAHAHDRYGRTDTAIGAVAVRGLSGESLANALMKAETKAKRRVTLSICGLGWLDEIEAIDQREVEVAPRRTIASAIASRTAALTGGTSPAGSPDAKPRKRGAKKDAAPLQAGDEGYGSARAHAMAAERGMDHAALHRIAADVLHIDEGDLADFSVKDLTEADWQPIIEAIAEAPKDPASADGFAAHAAVSAGVVVDVQGEWWAEASTMFDKPGEDLTPAELVEFGIRIMARNPLP